MKKLLTLMIMVMGLHVAAQTITVEGNYGSHAYTRPIAMGGSYEGLAISYRWDKPNTFWEVQGWNTDLTHLMRGHDKGSSNSFGAEYGAAVGFGWYMFSVGDLSLNITPQVGLTYNAAGAQDSEYRSAVQQRALNAVLRGMIQVNYRFVFLTFGSEYQDNSFINNNPYINRIWFGIGIKQ